jgi:predicted 3-demethylubiquinone-9 3-methyltransferase (glyoxalase superfamily)
VPEMMDDLFKDEKSPGYQRAMDAMLKMKKLDIAELQRAYDGES